MSAWDSFQSLEECKKVMTGDQFKKLVDDSKKEGHTLLPVCLPDTVDPREPKGK
jgi:hypothetical protein